MHWRCPRDAEKPSVHLNEDHQHAKMAATIIALSALTIGALAAAEPAVTAAVMLDPRQLVINPALVGYISASNGCKLFAKTIEDHSLTHR